MNAPNNDDAVDRNRAKQRIRNLLQGHFGEAWPTKARELLSHLDGSQGEFGTEMMIAAMSGVSRPDGRPGLPDSEILALVVDLYFEDMLENRDVRQLLLSCIDPGDLAELDGKAQGPAFGHALDLDLLVAGIVTRPWSPGRRWAKRVVSTLGLPASMAGTRGQSSPPKSEHVVPFKPLPPLTDFQEDVVNQLLEVLGKENGGGRAILTLPTGAGKTRTTVEMLIRLALSGDEPKTVLWIAQSEELCEQAVQAFIEVWHDLGGRGLEELPALIVGRFWTDNDFDVSECDVVVTTIQKLSSAKQDDVRTGLSNSVDVVVIDEAHRSLAPVYHRVLDALGIRSRRARFLLEPSVESDDIQATASRGAPVLLGLTATPRRSDDGDTRALLRMYDNTVIRPNFAGRRPVDALREAGVLSQVDSETIDYDASLIELDTDNAAKTYFEKFRDIHPSVLQRLGEEQKRNEALLARILQLPPDWPVLLFACSVQHSRLMTALLMRSGRTSASVSAMTRPQTRRHVVEQFRRGEVSVLSNYGVLTTGFDAPRVRCVVIARPTGSSVLYEQMVGRGLRGPRFGGTERCLIIDVKDNVRFTNMGTGMVNDVGMDWGAFDREMRAELPDGLD